MLRAEPDLQLPSTAERSDKLSSVSLYTLVNNQYLTLPSSPLVVLVLWYIHGGMCALAFEISSVLYSRLGTPLGITAALPAIQIQ